MEIAVLADIHGNYVALEKCIDFAKERGIETFMFLGDYVGELAYPQKAMKMIYELNDKYNCTFIKGNKENYWIDYRDNGNESYGWQDKNSTTGILLYAYNNLTAKDLKFFEDLPMNQKVELKGYESFLICHGSPYKINETMIPNSERIYEIMDYSETRMIICGHTHEQWKTTYKGKVVLNPGSVGLPILSEGKAQFLILHADKDVWEEEFISLDYDMDAIISDMRKDKLDLHAPFWNYSTERLLKDGKVSNGTVLNRVIKLCELEMGSCNWPHIPEKYWVQAIEEIFG